jgi:hypothetical protein
MPGKLSRRSSEWKEEGEESEVGDDGETPMSAPIAEHEEKGKAPSKH